MQKKNILISVIDGQGGGMGKMLPNAINQYNNIMIVALAFMFSLVSVLSVLAGDIVLTKVDPRISLSEKAGRS